MALPTCTHCGAPLQPGPARCPSCGHVVPTTDTATVSLAALEEPASAEPVRRSTVSIPALREDSPPGLPPPPDSASQWPRAVRKTDSLEAFVPGTSEVGADAPHAESHDGATRQPDVSPTLALTLAGQLEKTAIDGLEPIKRAKRRGVVEAKSGRHAARRVAPLVAVLLVAALALAAAGYRVLASVEVPAGDPPADDVVTLPAGEFVVGLTDDNKESVLAACFRLSDNPNHECRRSYLEDLGEYPGRTAAFGALRVDRFEVSNARWEACAAAGACARRERASCQFYTPRGYQFDAPVPDRMWADDLPAVCVTRDEADAFCAWVGGRLPTPEEWERAARGGTDHLSPWGVIWAPSLMNWAETDMGGFSVAGRLDGYDLTAPVTRFEDGATAEGVYNVYGNAAEWVAAAPAWSDGTRGGAYSDDLREYRITRQRALRPEARRSDVGFRCVY